MVEIMPNVDIMIVIQRTPDASLKANKNLVELERAPQTIVRLSKMLTKPSQHVSTTTTTDDGDQSKMPPQIDVEMEWGLL